MSYVNLFCLARFKEEVEKLRKNNSYRDIDKEVIGYFCDKTVEQVKSGTRLNNSADTPYIKKRLDGSGGFRFYFLLIIKDGNLYLMFVHPKSGSEGSENTKADFRAEMYKTVLAAIEQDDLYKVTPDKKRERLEFTKVEKAIAKSAPADEPNKKKATIKNGKGGKKKKKK